ncbi:MAG TPA: metalloregulator ArsR/SmtB family transcription factor [Bacillota bacterium]|nr:metalloregulator ArsR/SmtB family transcription factor [Bacillota bacterium]HOH11067.1 metalloregulator ArsR/SmtB family transcription factor [Bacillota bacterium]HOS50084.1 metalloregulator ArsR/SmtB family transcription factor [Bacillota bacterium]HOY88674.1 metalloregulator ArsR/SmtB family transcription factor [Bacillota bacterium]HPI01873.1 metalloregulator ArsR/SmtB family transcription factor [Bacillota bacterium]
MSDQYSEQAKIFKALCDEKRLRILELLRSGEKCACVLVEILGMPQSSLAYHMKVLCDSGIVDCRQEGKWTHYRISRDGSRHAETLLRSVTTPVQALGSEDTFTCTKQC